MIFTASIVNPMNTFYFSPTAFGDPTNGGAITTFAQAAVPMPVGCTFDKLYVSPSAVPNGQGLGGAIAITLYKNGAATTLTVSGSSSSPALVSASGSVSVVAGDLIALQGSGAGINSGQSVMNTSLHCQ
jgi:hypothetical protein